MTKREHLGLVGLGLVAAGAMAVMLFVPPFLAPAFATDSDSDGLSDSFEGAYGTNPYSANTDGDGWTDWNEIFVYGTDPSNVDTDGDGTNDHLDSTPLDDGNDADGNTTATWTWSENLSAPAWTGASAKDGKAIQMHSGEFTHSLTLLKIDPGYGPSMDLTISYRSGISFDGPVGNNWSWLPALQEQGTSHDIWYWPGDGTKRVYDYHPPIDNPPTPAYWTSPADGVYWPAMAKNQNGSYTLTNTHGLYLDFSSGGILTAVTDRFGNAVTYAYTSGKLSSITDATGHTVNVYWYSGKNRVQSITDGDTREVWFTYNHFGQLAKVRTPTSSEYPSGRTHQFVYSNGSNTPTLNDNMVQAKDPKGQVWLKNEFDENDRVVKQFLGPDYFTFSYNTGSGITTVYDREGNQREWYWSGKLPTALREYSNRDVRSTDPSYWQTNFGHNSVSLRNKVVYPRGNRVDTTYDSKGNVTEVRRKETDTDSTSSSDLVDAYVYDADYNLMTSHTDPKGNQTTYALEDDTQSSLYQKVVETITYPTVTYLDPDQTVTESFTWNSQGQLLSRTDGEGKVTSREYFGGSTVKKGYLKKVIVDSASGGLALTTEWDYTNWGTRTSVKNPRLKTTTYTVNEYDWVKAVVGTSPQGYETTYAYDANGNVTQKDVENVDKNNNRDTTIPWYSTLYFYDMLNNVSETREFLDAVNFRSHYYEYTKNERLKTLTKPEGNKVRYVYDERDLVCQRTRGYDTSAASTDQSDYDGNRNLSAWKNGRNKTWSHSYDNFDRRTKTTNPLGHYNESIYDKDGNVTEVKGWEEAGTTDVLLAHTKHAYDQMDRRYKTEGGLKGTSTWSFLATTTEFDKRSLPTKVTDPRSKSMTISYDGASRRTLAKDALNNETRHFYDENGNITKIDAICVSGCSVMRTSITEFAYDEVDRKKEQREVNENDSNDKHTTTFKYDSLHVLVERVDPESNTVTWTHDGLARVLSESIDLGSGASKTRSWAFDKNDRMTSHKDDANNETTWAYNARDLMTAESFADLEGKDYTYDAADNLTQWIDGVGTQVDLTYDDNNRNTARDVTRGTGVGGTTAEDFVYDALDRLTEAQDNDVTVQLTWDSLGRKLTEKSGPNPIGTSGKTTSYTYDDAGNVTRIDYPDSSFCVTRTFDDVNRLTEVKDGSSTSIVAIEFDSMTERLKKHTFGNGTTTHFGHDGFGRLTDLDHKTSTPTTFAGYDMSYDDTGEMLFEEWSHDSGKGHTYDYDKAHRLRKTLHECVDPSAEVANPGSQAYGKKLEYNLTDDSDRTSVVTTPYQQPSSTVSYSYNNVHEYTQVGSANRTYDDNGNLTDDGTRDYQYDYRNQLIKVTEGSNTLAEYEYDALGRRTKKLLPANVSVRFYHDGLHEVEEFDGNGDLLRKYVYRSEIDSIAMMEAPDQADIDNDSNTSELVRLFYHLDGRTNVARLTGPGQTMVERYESDPYGNLSIKDKNGTSVSSTQVGNPLVFHRRRHDDETGLVFFRARMYDPVRGNWTQRDPLQHGESCNLYEFVRSNPLAFVDPSGTQETGDTQNYETTGVLQSPSLYHESVRKALGAYGFTETWSETPPTNKYRVRDDNGKEKVVTGESWWSPETDEVICYDNPINNGINYVLGAHTEEVSGASKKSAQDAKGKAVENAKTEVKNRQCPSKCSYQVPLDEQWTLRACMYVPSKNDKEKKTWLAIGMAQYKFQCYPEIIAFTPVTPPTIGPGGPGGGVTVSTGPTSAITPLASVPIVVGWEGAEHAEF